MVSLLLGYCTQGNILPRQGLIVGGGGDVDSLLPGHSHSLLAGGDVLMGYCLGMVSLVTEEVVVLAFWLGILRVFRSSWILIWNAPHLIIELGVFFLSLRLVCSIFSHLLLSMLRSPSAWLLFFFPRLDLLRGYWPSEFLVFKVKYSVLGLFCWPACTFFFLVLFFYSGLSFEVVCHHLKFELGGCYLFFAI